MSFPYAYDTDWSRIARLMVHQSLQTRPGERVLIHADPTYFPALTEQVRMEINRAGAVELATHMLHPSGLERVRRQLRRREDPELRGMEDRVIGALFDLADIYIWLPTSWAYNLGQTEEILTRWRGRSIHFHWIHEPVDEDLFRRLSRYYDEALSVDSEALTAHQRRVIRALQGSLVAVTDRRGTNLRFALRQAHFHLGNGDCSKPFIDGYARPGSARDREVELPCGAIRTVDISDTEGTVLTPPETFGGRNVGSLRIEFRDNRIVRLTSEHHAAFVEGIWASHTGDRDRFGEFNVGVSPKLTLIPGVDAIPYFGYGAGIIRLSLGDNQESGGAWRSSYHQWLFLTDATVRADGRTVIDEGRLVLPAV